MIKQETYIHSSYVRLLSKVLVALPILLIIFIPRPPVGGAQFIIFPVIAFASAFIILNPANIHSQIFNLSRVGPILYILLFQAFLVTVSQTVNANFIRTTGVITVFRPVLLLMMLILGLAIARNMDKRTLHRGLYITGVLIIVGQFLIAVTQALNIPVFDLLYSTEKTRSLGQIFRITGSLTNPNIFGLLVTQAAIIVLLFSKKRIKYLWFTLAIFLMIASGSRSQLLIFPVIIVLAKLLDKPHINRRKIFQAFLLMFLGIIVILAVVYFYSETFRYLSQIFVLLESADLSAISSVSRRFEMWERGWDFFFADSAFYKWIVGLGSRPQFRIGDNDYFYTIWHYGLIGLVIHLTIYFVLFRMLKKSVDLKMKSLGISCLILLFILGFQVETMGGWLQPLTLFYFVGLTMGNSSIGRKIFKIAE